MILSRTHDLEAHSRRRLAPWPPSARMVVEAIAGEVDDLRRSIAELETIVLSFAQSSRTYRELYLEAVAALATLTGEHDRARRTIARLSVERRAAQRRAE